MTRFDDQLLEANNWEKLQLFGKAIETTGGAIATRRRNLLLQADRFLELTIASLVDLAERNGWEVKVMGGESLNHLICKVLGPTSRSSHSWGPHYNDTLFRTGLYPDIM